MLLIRKRRFGSGTVFTPLNLFSSHENGAWYDPSDIASLWQVSDGTTAVTAVGDPIGRVSDKSGNGNHAIQATSAARPIYDNVNTTVGLSDKNAYRIKHDFVDDLLKWTGTTGDYYIAVCTISGIQFYTAKLTQTTGSIPINDFIGMIILNREFTYNDRINITAYFTTKLDGVLNTKYLFECNTTSYTGRGGTCSAPLLWTFGSGATYSTMFTATQATTKRESLQFSFIDTALTIFDCSSNQLTGSIPSLSTNTLLNYFYCYNNQLTGSIPSLSTNTALTQFNCYTNKLTGSIPSLSTNTALTTFYCYNNQLTGSIPSLSTNTALTSFDCSLNQLTGSIPSLSTNTALTYFSCHTNQLTGNIPSLSTNTVLNYFSCYTNKLTGSIPSLSTNTALTIFYCHGNQLTGSIPSLSTNTALQIFYCSSNQLTGSIPSLSTNTALTIFYCYANQLTGSIPSLSTNTALTQFYCYANQLTGSIPSLSTNTALQRFYCYTNQLTGYDGGTVSITLGDFQAQNNLLSTSVVNAILAAFVAANKTTGTRVLNLGGTGNAAPTGQGIVDKATLITRGWTVTTNDTGSVAVPNLFELTNTAANAALSAAGLAVGTVTNEGLVISQSPVAGAYVEAGSSVSYTRSISDIQVLNITTTTALVRWTLNENSQARVEYGTTTSYGNFTTLESSFNYSTHNQQISGLTSNTLYHYRTHAWNSASYESISDDHTFTTLGDSNSVNVKDSPYNALGNGSHDDTANIQAAIAGVPTGGTVIIPAGTYMINALTALNPKSNITIQMETGAILKAITNNQPIYAVIRTIGVNHVNLVGGKILGERTTHTGPTVNSEWGHGINITDGSSYITVDGVAIEDCWGDGIDIGGSSMNSNITINNVNCNNNRRQGLSVVWCNGIVVSNSTFRNTNGTNPQCGIDIEPDTNKQVSNVVVQGCTFTNNAYLGIAVDGARPNVILTNVAINNCNFSGNNNGSMGLERYVNVSLSNNTGQVSSVWHGSTKDFWS